MSRGTEACVSSFAAVWVVPALGFLCSVLSWVWCGWFHAGSGARNLVGVFVHTFLVLWSQTGGSSAPAPVSPPPPAHVSRAAVVSCEGGAALDAGGFPGAQPSVCRGGLRVALRW